MFCSLPVYVGWDPRATGKARWLNGKSPMDGERLWIRSLVFRRGQMLQSQEGLQKTLNTVGLEHFHRRCESAQAVHTTRSCRAQGSVLETGPGKNGTCASFASSNLPAKGGYCRQGPISLIKHRQRFIKYWSLWNPACNFCYSLRTARFMATLCPQIIF